MLCKSMGTPACCCDDWRGPKSLSAPTDGTYSALGDAATTGIVCEFCKMSVTDGIGRATEGHSAYKTRSSYIFSTVLIWEPNLVLPEVSPKNWTR